MSTSPIPAPSAPGPHAHATDKHARLAACPNCGAPFAPDADTPPYCPQCSQATTLHPPSVAEFLHEFVGHYVAVEGKLWQTLRLLVLRPGRLTKEYLDGRRQRHVLPLRLYLSASFLFFLVAKFATPALPGERHAAEAPRAAVAASAPAAPAPSPDLCAKGAAHACNWIERRMNASLHELEADPDRVTAEFWSHFLAKAPYALFFLLPVFTAVLAQAYRGRRMLFGEHLVFCMHLITVWFLAAALAMLLPDIAGPVLFVLAALHAVRSLHVVYGGRWPWTIARAAVVAAAYGLLLLLGIVVMSVVLVLA